MTLDELLAIAEIVEKLTNRYRDQEAAHKAALTEIRASFNARTSADEKLIEGCRMEIIRLNSANDRLNDLLRAERLAHRDEVAALKSQTPKHPVKVGEWVRRSKLPGDQSPVGIVKQVTEIRCYGRSYAFADGDFWSVDNCEPCTHQHPAQDGHWVRRTVASGTEPAGTMIQVQHSRTLHSEYVTRGAQVVPWAHCEPCDPPEADHDTEAGKAAAEAALTTETVADEIKVGDVVEVFQKTGSCTFETDIGTRGTVLQLDSCVDTAPLEGYRSPKGHHVDLCDVRKVTT